jgi:hypothetical protein
MFYSGIDQHKLFSYITTVNNDGIIIKDAKVNNTSFDILNYFNSIGKDHTSQLSRLPADGIGSTIFLILTVLNLNLLMLNSSKQLHMPKSKPIKLIPIFLHSFCALILFPKLIKSTMISEL